MTPHQQAANFGGITFPNRSDQPAAPLGRRAALALQDSTLLPPPAVTRMLDELPPSLNTHVLQARYMHVLARLAARWQDPWAMQQVFDELIFENHRFRDGLSFEAIVELTDLQDHVKRTRLKQPASIWEQALGLA
jgi:hypothetical protein